MCHWIYLTCNPAHSVSSPHHSYQQTEKKKKRENLLRSFSLFVRELSHRLKVTRLGSLRQVYSNCLDSGGFGLVKARLLIFEKTHLTL